MAISSKASSTIWSCYVNLNHYHYSFFLEIDSLDPVYTRAKVSGFVRKNIRIPCLSGLRRLHWIDSHNDCQYMKHNRDFICGFLNDFDS